MTQALAFIAGSAPDVAARLRSALIERLQPVLLQSETTEWQAS